MQGSGQATSELFPDQGSNVTALTRAQRGIVLGMTLGLLAFIAALFPNSVTVYDTWPSWCRWELLQLGACFAAVCFLAAWAALSRRSLATRLPEALGLAALLALAFAWGVHQASGVHAMPVLASFLCDASSGIVPNGPYAVLPIHGHADYSPAASRLASEASA